MKPINLNAAVFAFTALALQASASAEDVSIPNATKQYDVVIKNVTCGGQTNGDVGDACSGEGSVDLLATGTSKVVQTIIPTYLKVIKGTPVFSSALNKKPRAVYGDTFSIVFEDFNFDGHDDIAVWTGNESGYGGPSYDVYLFNKKTHQFVQSLALSKLATEPYLGLFTVQNKHLITLSKSGCCYHETEEYKVISNKPLLTKKTVEQLNASGKYIVRTVKSKQNGKWVKKITTAKAR